MLNKLLASVGALILGTSALMAQGLETQANRDDWEEINFEFDSSILTDGYPSLLRLSDLLKQSSDYRVTLEGHTDFIGSDSYNQALSQRRAETVREFLVKYGAGATQVTLAPHGEGTPKVPNTSDEGRFMNRRVTVKLYDGDGNPVSDGTVGDAIDKMQQQLAMSEECCNKILQKLDKLDEILDLIKGLKGDNDELQERVAELEGNQGKMAQDIGDKLDDYPKTPQVERMVSEAKDEVIEATKPGPKYATFDINAGPSFGDVPGDGNLAVSGRGRVFVPFAKNMAFQTQGEFMHFKGRDEGQYDAGLVGRWGNVQAGGFASFKVVKWDVWQNSGTLGQGAFTLDYIFNKGRLGFFGTKAFMDGAVVNSEQISKNMIRETFLRVNDQVGVSTAVGTWGDPWIEGNLGAIFRHGGENKLGGTIRYIHPINSKVAFTVEAGVNQTYVSSTNEGRFVVGLQFGSWLSPHKYKDSGDTPVPVDVPRIRYEVLTRDIRQGNDLPVADAGPDQLGIEEGPVQLDGSGSYDPDGDEITFEWTQIAGESVSLAGADTATPTFTAVEGQTYHFRLTVRDDLNGVGTDRVTVSAKDQQISIRKFIASPTFLPGEGITNLVWDVEGADKVTITPMPGDVDNSGTSSVNLKETTEFLLTAMNSKRTVSEKVVVTVDQPKPIIKKFLTNRPEITKGETAELQWVVENATEVTITNVGPVGEVGSTGVSPESDTSYTLTAKNKYGEVSETVSIRVLPIDAPRILNFVASPTQILPGEQSLLSWEVEGKDVTVKIDPIVGQVDPIGTSTVDSLTDTTTFKLTATNESGSVSATAVVVVFKQVQINSFSANKTTVANPGEPAVLTWSTTGATRVVITGVGDVDPNGSATVNPVGTTIYTLIAYGENTETSAVITLNVENANRSPIAIAIGPRFLIFPPGTETAQTELDGSRSYDPDRDPITYEWRSIGEKFAEVFQPTAAKPTVEFQGGPGSYEFELMVTDDKGSMGFDTVRVIFDP